MTRSRSRAGLLGRVGPAAAEPAVLLALLSAARAGIGAVAFSVPVTGVRLLGVDEAAAVRMSWATRAFASRDLAVGLLGLVAARRGTRDALGTALLMGTFCDLGDVVTFLLAAREGQLGPARGYALVAASGGAVVAGVAGAAALRGRRAA